MATRLKYWMVMVAACVVVGVYVQSWNPRYYGFLDRTRAPHRAQRDSLSAKIRVLNSEYRAYTVSDSLLSMLDAAPGVTVRQGERASDDSVGIRKLVESQIALKPGEVAKARIGVFIVESDFASSMGVNGGVPRKEVYAGTDARGPYCIAVYTMPGARSDLKKIATEIQLVQHTISEREKTNLVGPCAFYARYGAPSASIDAWVRSAGYQFTSLAADGLWDKSGAKDDNITSSSSGLTVSAEACRGGSESSCVQTLKESVLAPARGPAIPFPEDRWYGSSVFGAHDGALMAHVEREFGSEKFNQFWHSSEPLEAAFQSAFGVPLGEWVGAWVQDYYGRAIPGARIAPGNALLALLFSAVMLFICVGITNRRQVA